MTINTNLPILANGNTSANAAAEAVKITVTHSEQSCAPAPQDQAPALRSTATQPQPPVDRTQEARRAAWRVQLGAALTPAGAAAGSILDILDHAFTPAEFKSLNPGFYHSTAHPVNVAAVAGPLAQGLGHNAADQDLIVKAAIIHDADARSEGTPARVPVTLQWMDDNQADVQARMGWNESQFNEAQAIIARTEYPFTNDAPKKSFNTSYDGKSPLQIYAEKLDKVDAERRETVMRLALTERQADQLGNYTGTTEQAVQTVHDLEREIKLPPNALLSGSAAFQAQVGRDVEHDKALAAHFDVDESRLPGRDELMAALPATLRDRLAANVARFMQAAK